MFYFRDKEPQVVRTAGGTEEETSTSVSRWRGCGGWWVKCSEPSCQCQCTCSTHQVSSRPPMQLISTLMVQEMFKIQLVLIKCVCNLLVIPLFKGKLNSPVLLKSILCTVLKSLYNSNIKYRN